MAITKSMGVQRTHGVSPSTGRLEARTVSIPPHPGVLPGPERLSHPRAWASLHSKGLSISPSQGLSSLAGLPHTSEKQLFCPLWSRPGIRRDLWKEWFRRPAATLLVSLGLPHQSAQATCQSPINSFRDDIAESSALETLCKGHWITREVHLHSRQD